MKETVQCIRRHAQMEVGYVPDATESGWAQQIWHRGCRSFDRRYVVGALSTGRCLPAVAMLAGQFIPVGLQHMRFHDALLGGHGAAAF
jgi:hypothetical protein